LPAGARVAVLFGAANLDEREFDDPERFDPARQNKVQLGWGNGAHTCVGIHLAKLEMLALLRAMVDRAQAIELAPPVACATTPSRASRTCGPACGLDHDTIKDDHDPQDHYRAKGDDDVRPPCPSA
jgi:cytochrome P450